MKKPKIAIVGPGIVGQATGKAFISKGLEVGFIGIDPRTVESLRQEGYNAYFPGDFTNGSYDFDITFLTVPTPTENGKINLSAIEAASMELGKRLALSHRYHLVVVKSTVLPQTTENLVIKLVEKYSGKKVGKDFGACMNPEYLREQTALADALDPWMILIGQYDRSSGDLLSLAYENFNAPIFRTTIAEAEIQKYIHNLFNAAKITFFNEMRQIGSQIGLDIERVFKLTTLTAEGLWNPKYGTKDKGPYSGSCLPKDTQAFLNWAETNGFVVDLLKTVIKVNNRLIQEQLSRPSKPQEQPKDHLPL